MAYTVDEKAMGIAIMRRFGGMTTEAIREIEAALGRKPSKSTLSAWLHIAIEANRTEPPAEPNRTEKKGISQEALDNAEIALDAKFENVARRYLDRALDPDAIAETKGKDAIIAAATATDKMRLLRNLPTEIVGILPGLIEKLQRAGKDPLDVFQRMEAALDGSISQELH